MSNLVWLLNAFTCTIVDPISKYKGKSVNIHIAEAADIKILKERCPDAHIQNHIVQESDDYDHGTKVGNFKFI